MEPLHPSVGKQLLWMPTEKDIFAPDPNHPRMMVFSRAALEQLWAILHDLQSVAVQAEK